jgi:2-methylisocitrate lyase-like PEP mutase family enzyme
MDHSSQKKKAERFLELHHDPKLLVLPNIWDPLGARLLVQLGYPAVATASAAVAYSLGYDDGEKIGFSTMLSVIRRIISSVDVPVSADIEGGYADKPADVADNVREVIGAGAVGINIEDCTCEGGPLHPVDLQCERIRAVRRMADKEGIPLVINARTDVFLSKATEPKTVRVDETIDRASAYVDAGADCVYPITVGDLETLRTIREAVAAPINVYASQKTAPMKELEAAGISRLSVGPGLLKASLTTIKQVALSLKDYGSYDSFTRDVISNEEILRCVSDEKMPD